MKAACNHRHALSLVEVIVSMLLVGLLLVGSMESVGGVYRAWHASQQIHDGMSLAQQLMAEILQQPYNDPDTTPLLGGDGDDGSLLGLIGLGASTTERTTYDDLNDYHGWSSAPEMKDGTALVGFEDWTREVSVAYARWAAPSQTTSTSEALKRITVTVTDPNGRQTVLTALRSPWGMLQQAADVELTAQSYVATELQVGTGVHLHSGGHLLNDAGGP